MITVKNLKKLLENLPDDAKCYAYEGERVGIGICLDLQEKYFESGYWWIDAYDCEVENTYTEGFENEKV